MPAEPLDPPQPRQSYSTCMLLHNVLKILAAIVITTGNVNPIMRAARDLLLAFGIEPDMGGAVTQHAQEPGAPNGDQRCAVERARELAEAAATVQTLAAYLGVSTQHPDQFFYAAYGAAIDRMRDLLASLDEAAVGQADPGGSPPHAYLPAGPVEAAPYEGYCPPEVRREAFAAVLEGVEMGAYDERMVEWLVGWDDPTCRTIASLLWRCRLAGRQEGRQ